MYTIEKTKRIDNDGVNGLVYTDCVSQNSVEFMADLPENAVVDYVEVSGADLKELDGKSLDEICIDADVKYPRGFKFDGMTVAAVVRFPKGPSNEKLYQHASIHNITSFVVHYHEVAFVNR